MIGSSFSSNGYLNLTYTGHSTVMIEMDGIRLLTDPLLRRRVAHLGRLVDAPNLNGSRVDAVLISHMHWDHVDGLVFFPEARVWIQEAEFDYYSGPAWEAGGDRTGIERESVSRLAKKNEEGRVTILSGREAEILDGITVFPGARHSFFSQFITVRTTAGTAVLASDNLCAYANIERGIPLATTFDADVDLWYFKRMKETASDESLILPGNVRAVFDRFPEVSPGIIRVGGRIGSGLEAPSSGF